MEQTSKRLLICLMLALLIASIAPAQSDVVFSNFGPGDTYLAGGWGVASPGPHIPFSSDTGERFIPAGDNFRLERVEIAISIAENATFSPDQVDVMLMTDEGDAPGVIIETFHFSGLGSSGTLLPPLAKDSVLRPVLVAGTPYWLVASAPLPDTLLAWHQNPIGGVGLHACRSSFPSNCVGTPIGQWFIHNDFQGAFRILGTPVGPAFVPFSAFTANVEIKLGPRNGDDEFEVKANFTLGTSNNGINPLVEAVSFQIGTFSTTIPAGSFEQNGAGTFTLEGTVDGATLEVKITPLEGNHFKFKAEGAGADLTGTVSPVTVTLTIGDDRGTITVFAELK